MGGKRKKDKERPVFESIRKPTAPPTRRFEKSKSDEKEYPARRHVKHKKKDDLQD